MDTKSMTAILIGLMVSGLILVAFVPIFTEVTATEDTYTNDGYYFMTEYPEGTEFTVIWDYTKPTVLSVNSVEVDLPDKEHMSTIPFTIFCSHSWYLRYGYENGYYVNIYQNASNTSYSGTVTDSRSLTVTVTDEGATTVNNGTDHTWSNAMGSFFVVSDTGSYVMKKMGSDAYVNGDSTIFGYGRTYARNYNYTSELSGSVDDGITGEYYPETTITTAGWTISDVTLNSVADAHHDDLYKISTMTYEITGDGIIPYTATFSQYIVPYEITAERSVHGDDAFNTVLNLIPLIAGLGLLLGAVYYFITRR